RLRRSRLSSSRLSSRCGGRWSSSPTSRRTARRLLATRRRQNLLHAHALATRRDLLRCRRRSWLRLRRRSSGRSRLPCSRQNICDRFPGRRGGLRRRRRSSFLLRRRLGSSRRCFGRRFLLLSLFCLRLRLRNDLQKRRIDIVPTNIVVPVELHQRLAAEIH